MSTTLINVLEPGSGQPFGIGYRTRFNWTGGGPVLDPFWLVFVQNPDGTQNFAQLSVNVTDPHTLVDVTMSNQGQIPELISSVTDGGSARVHIELHGSTGLVDSISLPIQYAAHDGGTVLLDQGLASAGFQPSDRSLLQAIHDAVLRTLRTSA